MRIGIVAYWFNRGQGVVARQLRSALEDLGHETFVLARPTRKTNIKPDWVDESGVWDQAGVTRASDYLIPGEEYERWAGETGVELAFFDQNYQFDEIERLRHSGVRTVGRFVWEHFTAADVNPATAAFETIYSLTGCERERYADLGIESPRVHWGCHPDLVDHDLRSEPDSQTIPLMFPGGFMSKRKPLAEVIEAFRAAEGPELRLVLKAQVERRLTQVKRMARGGRIGRRDPRIDIITRDLPTEEYLRLFASAAAIVAPSRWEGLGLHLYEATALGIPIVTNDNPPMNEIVVDGRNGLLVPGIPDGEARSGIPAFRPDVEALTAAIERLRDPELRKRLAAGARERRGELSWERTTGEIGRLVEGGGGASD
ncbi:MAG TPA: glycosyltransferase family 4 protein [Solirubrobacterales bacterium]|nr:glycosyltransferase family 4 protein [Solirubrobacterales bacterium]